MPPIKKQRRDPTRSDLRKLGCMKHISKNLKLQFYTAAIQARSQNIKKRKMKELDDMLKSIREFVGKYFPAISNLRLTNGHVFFDQYPMRNRRNPNFRRKPTLAELMFGDYSPIGVLTPERSLVWKAIQEHVEDIRQKLKNYFGITSCEAYLDFDVKKQNSIGKITPRNNMRYENLKKNLTPLQLMRRAFYDVVSLLWAGLTLGDPQSSTRYPLVPGSVNLIEAIGERFGLLVEALGTRMTDV